MARLLFAWELGAGLGHIVPLVELARPLVARGHHIDFVWRDLSDAQRTLGELAASSQVRVWQAPVWLPQLQGGHPPVSYTELLFRAGYLDGQRLLGLVRGWREIIQATGPDLMLADYSPTALLAARSLGLRRAAIGNGFYTPPARQPMSPFVDAARVDPERLRQGDAIALAACNSALQALGAQPMAALKELVTVDETFLMTLPELDHYGTGSEGREGGRYWGPVPATDQGEAPQWPAGDGPPLLAYLKVDYPALDTALQRLAASPWRSLVHVDGLSDAQRMRHAGPRLRFSAGPVAMAQALKTARAVVCHGGTGTACQALLAGVPLLLLPMQAEQALMAQRVAASGAGLSIAASEAAARLGSALTDLIGDARIRAAAAALAARHALLSDGQVMARVVERLEEVCSITA